MTNWQIILEVSVIAFILVTLIVNAKRGLVKNLFNSIKSIAVFVLAAVLTPMLVGYCSEYLVNDWFANTITPQLVEAAEQAGENFNMDVLSANMPEEAKGVFEMINKGGLLNGFNGVELATELGAKLEGLVINIVSYVITYIALYIVLSIILTIVFKLLEKVVQLPVLKQADHVLGFVWGILVAYLESSLILAILPLFTGEELIEGTFVTRFIYENGLFTNLLETIL